MPTVTDMFPGKYLASKESAFTENGRPNGKKYPLTVAALQQEEVKGEGRTELKWVMYFTESKKGLVLNKTAANVLEYLFGGDSETWIGQKVLLFAEMTEMMGSPCTGLRLSGVEGVQAAAGSVSLPTPNLAGAAAMSTPLPSAAPGTIQPIMPGNSQAPLGGNGPTQSGPPAGGAPVGGGDPKDEIPF